MLTNESAADSVNMFRWGMIVALHRDTLNQFLLQLYIKRYKSSESLPPVSGVLDAAGGEWRYRIESFLMSKPSMSFEATGMNDSRANMLMRVIGGNQINEKFTNGRWYAQTVEYFSPAQGPALRFNLHLADTPLIVGADDSVYIDLKDSDDFILEFSEVEHDQEIGGDFFKVLFNKLDPEQRRYPIGNLAGNQELDASLKPRSVTLRTQRKTKANDDPEGAVLLFVQLGNELRGTLPEGEQLGYLLDADLTARVLINRESAMLILTKNPLIKSYNATLDSVERDEEGRATRLNMTCQGYGFLAIAGPAFRKLFVGRKTFSTSQVTIPGVYPGQNMGVTLDASGLKIAGLKVDGKIEYVNFAHIGDAEFLGLLGKPSDKIDNMVMSQLPWESIKYDLDITYPRLSGAVVGWNAPSESLESSPTDGLRGECSASLDEGTVDRDWNENDLNAYVYDCLETMRTTGMDEVKENFKKSVALSLAVSGGMVNLSNLVQLNFGKLIAVRSNGFTHELHGDVQGDIAPKLTHFTLSPLEKIIPAGSGFQFSVIPANPDLEWTLEGTSRNELGDITGEGHYTSPDASLFDGLFMHVRINATDKKTGNQSSALVTVVKNPLIINPLIDSTSGQTRKLKAGSVGDSGQPLEWTIKKTGTEGSVEGSGSTAIYTPKKDLGPDKIFVVDEVTVSSGKHSATCYIVNRTSDPVNVIAYEVEGNTVQCKAMVNNKEQKATWKVLVGPGEIDSNSGLYNADTASIERFALIHSIVEIEDFDLKFEGYLILPLPLAEKDRALPGTVKLSKNEEKQWAISAVN